MDVIHGCKFILNFPSMFFQELFQIVNNHDDQSSVARHFKNQWTSEHYTGTVGGTYRAGCGHLLTQRVNIYNQIARIHAEWGRLPQNVHVEILKT